MRAYDATRLQFRYFRFPNRAATAASPTSPPNSPAPCGSPFRADLGHDNAITIIDQLLQDRLQLGRRVRVVERRLVVEGLRCPEERKAVLEVGVVPLVEQIAPDGVASLG